MGQQQLLLIVLGVIIVGIAVVVGITIFTSSSANANRDSVIADCTNLAAMAQQYFRKPTAMAGGGNSFVGWTIPAALATTGNGTYALSAAATATGAIIVGTGNEIGNDATNPVQVTMTVTSTTISTAINN